VAQTLFIIAINREIDRLLVPHGINEDCIDRLLSRLDEQGDRGRPEFWLLTARMVEMALLCAGHYADNLEFSAAGDLLVNPKRIIVYQKGYQNPVVKPRHEKLSDALGLGRAPDRLRCRKLLHETLVQVTHGPLLPTLVKRIRDAHRFPAAYIDRLRRQMAQVADAIGFLSTWRLTGIEDLQQRLRTASPETRDFVAAHLCRFDDGVFRQLGEEIRRQVENPRYRSRFLDKAGGAVAFQEHFVSVRKA
jgi:hypothetical protein